MRNRQDEVTPRPCASTNRALQLEKDELASFRDRFYVRPGVIYMNGSYRGEAALLNSLKEWKGHGIRGWTEASLPWFYLSEELGKLQAAMIGAAPDEIVVTSSTTVNLHNLLSTFYRPDCTGTERSVIDGIGARLGDDGDRPATTGGTRPTRRMVSPPPLVSDLVRQAEAGEMTLAVSQHIICEVYGFAACPLHMLCM